MPTHKIAAGETEQLASGATGQQFRVTVKSSEIRVADSNRYVGQGDLLETDDRVTVQLEDGDDLYAKNVGNTAATVEVVSKGLIINYMSRTTQTAVGDVFDGVATGQVTVSSAGTAVQLPSQTVPKGAVLSVSAVDGDIYVGDSSVDSSSGYYVPSGSSVSLRVSDASEVYVDADTDGTTASWAVESDS